MVGEKQRKRVEREGVERARQGGGKEKGAEKQPHAQPCGRKTEAEHSVGHSVCGGLAPGLQKVYRLSCPFPSITEVCPPATLVLNWPRTSRTDVAVKVRRERSFSSSLESSSQQTLEGYSFHHWPLGKLAPFFL